MTSRDELSLAWSLDYAARRLAGAFERAAPSGEIASHLLRGVWAAACRELHFLEMLVRRLLVFMAGQITVPEPSMRARAPAPYPARPECRPASAGFALAEPLENLQQIIARHGPGSEHRSALARALGAGPALHPVVSAEGLAARFAALARVLADPLPYARRIARFLQTPARADRAWRAGLLRHGVPPGLARGQMPSPERSAYQEADRLARVTLNQSHGPPGWADAAHSARSRHHMNRSVQTASPRR